MRRTLILLGMIIGGFAVAGIIRFCSTPSFDKSYKLEPTVWRGVMKYGPNTYPFELQIAEVKASGQFSGVMIWNDDIEVQGKKIQGPNRPRSEYPVTKLRIEGTARANHLRFEDVAVEKGDPAATLYDRKEVYITGTLMQGTDKNGRAELRARLVGPLESPVQYANDKPETSVQSPGLFGRLTRTRAICEALVAQRSKYADDCESTAALMANDAALCPSAPARGRFCAVRLAARHGNADGCRRSGTDSYRRTECLLVAAGQWRDPTRCDSLASDGIAGTSREQFIVACQAVSRGQQLSSKSSPAGQRQMSGRIPDRLVAQHRIEDR